MPTSPLEPSSSAVCSAGCPTLQPGPQEVKAAGSPAAKALPAPRVAGRPMTDRPAMARRLTATGKQRGGVTGKGFVELRSTYGSLDQLPQLAEELV